MKIARQVWLSTLLCLATRANQPLNDRIQHHEKFNLDLDAIVSDHARVRRSGKKTETLRVKFRAFKQQFDLSLVPNHDMIAPRFKVMVHDEEGERPYPFDYNIFYKGVAKGIFKSNVRAKVSNGTFEATIMAHKEIFVIEHAHRHNVTSGHSHVIYRQTDITSNVPATCGLDSHEHGHGHMDVMQLRQHVEQQSQEIHNHFNRRGFQGDNTRRVCEMMLVADHRFFASTGQSQESTTSSTMIEWLDFVNTILKQTNFNDGIGRGIQVKVAAIRIYTSRNSAGNPFASDTSDSAVFLDQLSTQSWGAYCLAHAFTDQDFGGGVVGLARVGTICQAPFNNPVRQAATGQEVESLNAGITTTVNFGEANPILQTKLVLAHEIGHNFGASHDDACSTFCRSNPSECSTSSQVGVSGNYYLMWPSSVDGTQPNNDLFSACSIDSMTTRINSGSGAGGFCFTDRADAICGNGIVELGEDCDCGSDDASICTQNDPCCTPTCELALGNQCSPQAGPCCTASCQMSGILPDNITTASDEDKQSSRCFDFEDDDCYEDIFCIQDSKLKGRCPDRNYPCNMSDVGSCAFTFHKPPKTPCNDDANVCEIDGCTGSICSLYTTTDQANGGLPSSGFVGTEAQNCEANNDCEIACQFQEGASTCTTTFAYASTPHGQNLNVSGKNRAPGRPCQDFTGFCDGDGTCFETSADAPLDIILSAETFSWLLNYWYITWSIAVVLVAFPFITRHLNYRKGGRIKIAERRKSHFQTMRRPDGVKKDRNNNIIVELHRQKASSGQDAPNEGKYRLRAMFPSATDEVLQTVMACSPHEEAAVYRLLLLGYEMRKLADYKFLAFAGKRYRQDMKKLRAQQLQDANKARQNQAQPTQPDRGGARGGNGRGRGNRVPRPGGRGRSATAMNFRR
eukprot:TRINITY_DN8006_c0_g1_i2.p1 TRINITY_DN8006_c0_g1~~TRINITY_DN8006_c0_g1_i2.p1  ORF type:complete len:909 (+),score=143.27 TRINITY_DN8006_c0_g1_i2:91-2817(+)